MSSLGLHKVRCASKSSQGKPSVSRTSSGCSLLRSFDTPQLALTDRHARVQSTHAIPSLQRCDESATPRALAPRAAMGRGARSARTGAAGTSPTPRAARRASSGPESPPARLSTGTPQRHRRSRCFLEVSVDGQRAGRLVVELLDELLPETSENFRLLCSGDAPSGASHANRRLRAGVVKAGQPGGWREADAPGGVAQRV